MLARREACLRYPQARLAVALTILLILGGSIRRVRRFLDLAGGYEGAHAEHDVHQHAKKRNDQQKRADRDVIRGRCQPGVATSLGAKHEWRED